VEPGLAPLVGAAAGVELDDAAAFHRVAGVGHQVEQGGFERGAVGPDGELRDLGGQPEFDIRGQDAIGEGHEVAQEGLDHDPLGGRRVPAYGVEETARQTLAPAGGLGDLGQEGVALIGRDLAQQVEVPAHHREQVPEVVGDSGRQAPDRLALLGGDEVGLELLEAQMHAIGLQSRNEANARDDE
jgi:hypothetical protein